MNFPNIINEILAKGYTLSQIAQAAGMASSGHVHDLKSGRQEKVTWEVGEALRKLHQSAMRRKARK